MNTINNFSINNYIGLENIPLQDSHEFLCSFPPKQKTLFTPNYAMDSKIKEQKIEHEKINKIWENSKSIENNELSLHFDNIIGISLNNMDTIATIFKNQENLFNDQNTEEIKKFISLKVKKSILQENKYGINLNKKINKLPFSIQVSNQNKIILSLKNRVGPVGKGIFRTVYLGICLSEQSPKLIAFSKSKFIENPNDYDFNNQPIRKLKNYSDKEIEILKKIANYLTCNPQKKGLLQFYGNVDYEPEKLDDFLIKNSNLLSNRIITSTDDLLFDDENETRENNEYLNTIRTISTKFYNFGNLETFVRSSNSNKKFHCLQIAYFLLQGLTSLHSIHIFHSDIKPDNILLDFDSEKQEISNAVLGDLGFACDLSNKEDRFYKSGDSDYLAPELKKFDNSSSINLNFAIDETVFACDVYSLGLVFKKLFSDFSPPPLNELIEKMIAENPLKRPSASDALIEYQNIMNQNC